MHCALSSVLCRRCRTIDDLFNGFGCNADGLLKKTMPTTKRTGSEQRAHLTQCKAGKQAAVLRCAHKHLMVGKTKPRTEGRSELSPALISVTDQKKDLR